MLVCRWFSPSICCFWFCLKEGWVVPKILYNKIRCPWSMDSYTYPCSSGKYLQKGLRNVWLWHVENKLRNRCYSTWPWFQMIFDQHESLTTWTHLVLCPSIIDRHTFDFWSILTAYLTSLFNEEGKSLDLKHGKKKKIRKDTT